MARTRSPWAAALAALLAFLAIMPCRASLILGTNADGVTQYLEDNRYPALYTGNFGDCMGGQSLLNVTAFDAAYYADNMTVLFHVYGSTDLRNESIMSVFPMRIVPYWANLFFSVHLRRSLYACNIPDVPFILTMPRWRRPLPIGL
jgi:hypothetical protein